MFFFFLLFISNIFLVYNQEILKLLFDNVNKNSWAKHIFYWLWESLATWCILFDCNMGMSYVLFFFFGENYMLFYNNKLNYLAYK